jgi:choline kinase
MTLKVCIPTAGLGSRLGDETSLINKSLVSIANRPVISYQIDCFPETASFVIPIGYKGNLVKEFLQLAYPNRSFEFIDVSPYEGKGSGLGLSLLKCEGYLQEPFIFLSCDTLFIEKVPILKKNWVGYSNSKMSSSYRSIKIVNERVAALNEKEVTCEVNHKPYIGIAGIYDFEKFWLMMKSGGLEAIELGEVYGLRSFLDDGIYCIPFTWHDTGNLDFLNKARLFYQRPDQPNILKKDNESIWFVGNSVIKFSSDKNFIKHRIARAIDLADYVPKITGSGENMYKYSFSNGQVFSDIVNVPLFQELLTHAQKFWSPIQLNESDSRLFRERCMRFYKDKTYERVELFFKTFSKLDGTEVINGLKTPTINELLGKVNWTNLSSGYPGRFHGDFHFENILWNKDRKAFTFLDWRQDFGGDLFVGDIYYDFAKLMHGLIINHEIIVNSKKTINNFFIEKISC